MVIKSKKVIKNKTLQNKSKSKKINTRVMKGGVYGPHTIHNTYYNKLKSLTGNEYKQHLNNYYREINIIKSIVPMKIARVIHAKAINSIKEEFKKKRQEEAQQKKINKKRSQVVKKIKYSSGSYKV